jgi:hypothetical protein
MPPPTHGGATFTGDTRLKWWPNGWRSSRHQIELGTPPWVHIRPPAIDLQFRTMGALLVTALPFRRIMTQIAQGRCGALVAHATSRWTGPFLEFCPAKCPTIG